MRGSDLTTAEEYWIAAAVFGGIALWALRSLFRRLQRDRIVADTPLVRIRSAAQGYVKVTGRAEPGDAGACAAPLSSRECVWWKYEIAERVRNSRDEDTWNIVESATSVDAFAISDGEATCLVGPVSAEISPTVHDVWFGSAVRPGGPPPRDKPLWRTGGFRYTESLLRPGDRLCVLGELRSHSQLGASETAVAEKLRDWKLDQRSLLARFDRNHDGRIDGTEWDAAREAATDEVQGTTLRATVARTTMITEPRNGEPFLITPLSGDDLARRERRFAALYFVLGLASIAACGWAIIQARLSAIPGL